jgi:hypothetical protein
MDTTALLVRLVGALSPSLLHPDEIFQAAEPLSYLLSPNATLAATIAWEWRCDAPIRSVIAPLALVGAPFALLRALPLRASARAAAALALPRLFLAGAGVFAERFFLRAAREGWAAERVEGARIARAAAQLLALSWPAAVMLARPLSNTAEALALATAIALCAKLERAADAAEATRLTATLGLIGALGCFLRFTFPLFALPILLASASALLRRRQAAPAAAGAAAFLVTVAAATAADKAFFALSFAPLAPLNALAYNSDVKNLSLHGTHPRWLHAGVNMLLLFGPLWAIVAAAAMALCVRRVVGAALPADYLPDGGLAAALRRLDGAVSRPSGGFARLCGATVVCGLALLSAAPHQEPRFLLPLLFPMSVLGAVVLTQARKLGGGNGDYEREEEDSDDGSATEVRRATQSHATVLKWQRAFWVLYAVFNAVAFSVFGFAHQAGVQPVSAALSHFATVAAAQGGGSVLSTRAHEFVFTGLAAATTADARGLVTALRRPGFSGAVLTFGTYGASQALLMQPLPTSADEAGGGPQNLTAPWCRAGLRNQPPQSAHLRTVDVASSDTTKLQRALEEAGVGGRRADDRVSVLVAFPANLLPGVVDAAIAACQGLAEVGEPLLTSAPHFSTEAPPSSLFDLYVDVREIKCGGSAK